MATTIPNLQADFMNRYTSEVPPMPGLMGGLTGQGGAAGGAAGGGGGRTGGIGLVQNRSASQWSGVGTDGGVGGGSGGGVGTSGGVASQSRAQIDPLSFSAGVGGGLSGPGATGDLDGDLDAGIPGHHSAEDYGGVIGDIHSGLQGAFGALSNLGGFGALSQAASYSQQKDFDKTNVDKPSTIAAMDPMGFGVFGGTPVSGILGMVGMLADKMGFGFDPAIAGEDLGGYGLGEGFGGAAGVAGVSGFGGGGSYGEGYGGLSGDMGGFGEGSIGAGNSQGAGDEGDGGSTW